MRLKGIGNISTDEEYRVYYSGLEDKHDLLWNYCEPNDHSFCLRISSHFQQEYIS